MPHRVAARRFEANDARSEPEKLPRGECPGQVAGQIDDERPPERLHLRRNYHYPATALGERVSGTEEKRRLILDAAVRVFAHKGFHTSRVGDIAEEAGVAHGLLYHYFASKDEVLETIFRENWGVLVERLDAVVRSDESARDQLRHVRSDPAAHVASRAGRRPRADSRDRAQRRAAGADRRSREADRGDPSHRRARPGAAASSAPTSIPALAADVFYGGIDELLTGWVLGQLPGRRRGDHRRRAHGRRRRAAPASPLHSPAPAE